MFKRKSKTDQLIENKDHIKRNLKELNYIKEVLINVYNETELAFQIDPLIEDLMYVNPSTSEDASKKHERLDQLFGDMKRLFSKYSLELNTREFQKLLKKIKLEIYERKNI